MSAGAPLRPGPDSAPVALSVHRVSPPMPPPYLPRAGGGGYTPGTGGITPSGF
ncbi:hypothetical protein [Kitasatospora sp. NPDC056531]|uniref:hypothetical protein n=1 Tax=Kitasatospora sp. NPDC056531 TaxID=3345856 RepID=UPI0036D065D2